MEQEVPNSKFLWILQPCSKSWVHFCFLVVFYLPLFLFLAITKKQKNKTYLFLILLFPIGIPHIELALDQSEEFWNLL